MLYPQTPVLIRREGYQNVVLRRQINSHEVEKLGPVPRTGCELSDRDDLRTLCAQQRQNQADL